MTQRGRRRRRMPSAYFIVLVLISACIYCCPITTKRKPDFVFGVGAATAADRAPSCTWVTSGWISSMRIVHEKKTCSPLGVQLMPSDMNASTSHTRRLTIKHSQTTKTRREKTVCVPDARCTMMMAIEMQKRWKRVQNKQLFCISFSHANSLTQTHTLARGHKRRATQSTFTSDDGVESNVHFIPK